MQPHIHFVGIGGIGTSALARYYSQIRGYRVTGSDASDFSFRSALESEGIRVVVGHDASLISHETERIVFSEAVITKPDLSYEANIQAIPELSRARELGIETLSYPKALSEVFNAHQGIAVTGSHGKSTTTAMIGVMMRSTDAPISTLVGTQVPQLNHSNFFGALDSPYFAIEACEYKRSFLEYRPYITVITNIDLDHLDYYRDLEDYLSAFQSLVDQTSGYIIIPEGDTNIDKLQIPQEKCIRVSKEYISYFAPTEELMADSGEIKHSIESRKIEIPSFSLLVPGEHLEIDARLAFAVGRLISRESIQLIEGLESYQGSWRRSELVGETVSSNLVISDYGHHPHEIRPTLHALKQKYSDKKLFVVFQPHQYSRTKELLEEFVTSFDDADELYIPDIYFSRDSSEDVQEMTVERFIGRLRERYLQTLGGSGIEEAARYLEYIDHTHPSAYAFVLLGAGDVDKLRESFEYKKNK